MFNRTQYSFLYSSVGVYAVILKHIARRDVTRFWLVFIVVLISFGGGFYLALRGEVINGRSSNSSSFNPVDDTSLGIHPDETRSDLMPHLATCGI